MVEIRARSPPARGSGRQYGSHKNGMKSGGGYGGLGGYNSAHASYGASFSSKGTTIQATGQWPRDELNDDGGIVSKDWTYKQEEERVWKILKRKMTSPFRDGKWTKISATIVTGLLIWLCTAAYMMAWTYPPHPVKTRNWPCHYIHSLPNVVMRAGVIPIPLSLTYMVAGVGRFPCTTFFNMFCCFCHLFCGFCLWFIAVADELPGMDQVTDAYGIRSYTPFHAVSATTGYTLIEIARDFSSLMCIADAVIITHFYKQWKKQNSEREVEDSQRMAQIVIESVENRKNGVPLNEATQRELALFQRRQWTQKAFQKLVFLLQIIAVLSIMQIFSIFHVLHDHGAHNWVFVKLRLVEKEGHPYEFQAPLLIDLMWTLGYFYLGTFIPFAVAQCYD
ncbi:unnamed protein product [Amoebophrya sp. A25]|nr:unnamed protein product [Amoebophrya sp. A25]|eukprot:GSA25T00012483001.1